MRRSDWERNVDHLAEKWRESTRGDAVEILALAAAGWKLRYETELTIGADIWLDAVNMVAELDADEEPAVTASDWRGRQTGRKHGCDPVVARLAAAANGAPIDAIAPFLAPWQLHAALAEAVERTGGSSAELIGTLIRWMPTRRTKRAGKRQVRDYAMPAGAQCARRVLMAAAAGIRIAEEGWRIRTATAGAALANVALTATSRRAAQEHVLQQTRRIVLEAIGSCPAEGRMSAHEAQALDKALAEACRSNPTTTAASPVRPLRLDWSDEYGEDETVMLRAHRVVAGDQWTAVAPAEAAVLSRWAKPNADPHLLRYIAADGAAIALTAESLPAMNENERWSILETASGVSNRHEEQTCSDAALTALEAGTRRAVTANERVRRIGCYLIELDPAAQAQAGER